MLVEGFAVVEPGEQVALVVVHQAAEVGVEAQQAAHQTQLRRAQRGLGLQQQHAHHAGVVEQREGRSGPALLQRGAAQALLIGAARQQRAFGAQRQLVHAQGQRVGVGQGLAGGLAGAQVPARVVTIADGGIHAGAARRQGFAQQADQREVELLQVPDPGDVGKLIHPLAHQRNVASLASRKAGLSRSVSR
jgi:hypothetical protein